MVAVRRGKRTVKKGYQWWLEEVEGKKGLVGRVTLTSRKREGGGANGGGKEEKPVRKKGSDHDPHKERVQGKKGEDGSKEVKFGGGGGKGRQIFNQEKWGQVLSKG